MCPGTLSANAVPPASMGVDPYSMYPSPSLRRGVKISFGTPHCHGGRRLTKRGVQVVFSFFLEGQWSAASAGGGSRHSREPSVVRIMEGLAGFFPPV